MPSGGPKRPLYLAGSVAELQKQANVPNLEKMKAQNMLNSSAKVLAAAEKEQTGADEEKAYVLYMKYVQVVQTLKKSADYKKDTKFYDDMIGKKSLKKSIEALETLQMSLEHRYEEKKLASAVDKLSLKPIAAASKSADDSAAVNGVGDDNGEKEDKTKSRSGVGPSAHVLEPRDLYNLIREKSTSFLVLDARPAEHCKASHVKHPNHIVVPEKLLLPGTTAKKVEQNLHVETRAQWRRRTSVDKLILMDWTSEDFTANTPLLVLHEALSKWDVSSSYQSKQMYILRGGFENFAMHYPMYVTDPARARAPIHAKPSILDDVSSVEYPDLDNAFIQTPSPRPSPSPSIPSGDASNSLPAHHGGGAGGAGGAASTPAEKSSPAAAAATIYPSLTDRIVPMSGTLASSAITITRSSTPHGPGTFSSSSQPAPPPPRAPHVPDRNTKPSASVNGGGGGGGATDSSGSSSRLSAASSSGDRRDAALNAAMLGDDDDGSASESSTSAASDVVHNGLAMAAPPKVDRSLKARALLQLGGGGGGADQICSRDDVIEAEKELLEDSIQREKQQLRLERQWEQLRLKREKQAEDEMKAELIRKEDLLLEKLERALEEKEARDSENERLRQQLADMKRRLEAVDRAKVKAGVDEVLERKMQEKLKAKEDEAAKIRAEVERKRETRTEEQRRKKDLEEQIQREQRTRDALEKRILEEEAAAAEVRRKEAAAAAEQQRRLEAERRRRRLAADEDEKRANDHERPPTSDIAAAAAAAAAASGGDTLRLKTGNEEPSTARGSLNRSYSSPNIARMLEEEDQRSKSAGKSSHGAGSTGATVPSFRFDRALKPESVSPDRRGFNRTDDSTSVVHKREFKPTFGFQSKKGLTGLKNLGNTCYMNSILQCISNFTIPSGYFIEQEYRRHLNQRNSETKGEIAIEFAAVLEMLWSGQYKSISPYDLKRVIGKYSVEFRGSAQQDAHELLMLLMEWLHNDVNEVREKVQLPEQKNEGLPDIQAAEQAWEMEKRADRSSIREMFYGQRRQVLKCRTCGYTSVTYHSFFELSLELPAGNGAFSLEDCIKLYLKTVPVTYKCAKCNCQRDCLKKFDIVKFPLILTIHLARFYNDGLWRKKPNFVDFPLQDLDCGRYAEACDGKLNRYSQYRLYGVCNHFGSMEGGHYTAYCYSQVYQQWYKYDDHEVDTMQPNEVKKNSAYILFYSIKN